MKKEINTYMAMGSAVVIGMFICHSQVAQAGWTGVMNGTGYGWDSVNVTPSNGTVTTVESTLYLGKGPSILSPSAAMGIDTTYKISQRLPNGSAVNTVAKIKGIPGYIWTANCRASNGDKADNSQLAQDVTVIPTSSDATTTLEVLGFSSVSNDSYCGQGTTHYTVTWHWSGSDAGTAQQISFYQFVHDDDVLGSDGSLPDDAIFLGSVVGSGLGCGDSDTGTGLCWPPGFDKVVNFSFCTTETDISKIYMVTEGIAESLPGSATGIFTGFLPPIGGADATGGNCDAPVREFKLGSTIPVKFGLGGCKGGPLPPGDHTLWLSKCGSGTLDPAKSTDGATIGNFFRKTGNQWHFNLSTKGLSEGTWELIAILYDGSANSSTHRVFVELSREIDRDRHHR
jgi:hypothetical protein